MSNIFLLNVIINPPQTHIFINSLKLSPFYTNFLSKCDVCGGLRPPKPPILWRTTTCYSIRRFAPHFVTCCCLLRLRGASPLFAESTNKVLSWVTQGFALCRGLRPLFKEKRCCTYRAVYKPSRASPSWFDDSSVCRTTSSLQSSRASPSPPYEKMLFCLLLLRNTNLWRGAKRRWTSWCYAGLLTPLRSSSLASLGIPELRGVRSPVLYGGLRLLRRLRRLVSTLRSKVGGDSPHSSFGGPPFISSARQARSVRGPSAPAGLRPGGEQVPHRGSVVRTNGQLIGFASLSRLKAIGVLGFAQSSLMAILHQHFNFKKIVWKKAFLGDF